MDLLKTIELKLSEVEKKIQSIVIDDKVYELLDLLNQRVKLGKDIHTLIWKSKTKENKRLYRLEDLQLTKKYLDKYGGDIGEKYLYKQQYFTLIDKIVEYKSDLKDNKNPIKILLDIIEELLENDDYVSIHNNNCLSILFINISKLNNFEEGSNFDKLTEIVDIFNQLFIQNNSNKGL